MNNPYIREDTLQSAYKKQYAYELKRRRAIKALAEENRRKVLRATILCRMSMLMALLLMMYLLVLPVHNPFKYEWVVVQVKAGDTVYELQQEYAPNCEDVRWLVFQDSLKNTRIENLQVGEHIYIIKERGLQ